MLIILAMVPGLIGWGVICFLATLALSAWLVRYFARPHTPLAIYVVTWLAWVCSFSVIWLVPLDVPESSRDSLYVIWNIVFWVGFVTTWLLLPMVQEYYDNGGFNWQQRLLLALRQNLLLVAVAGTLVTLLIVYMAVAQNLDSASIGQVFKVLSNTFGLILLCLLGGYGLVELPRMLYYASHRQRRRDFVYFTASTTHHEAEDARDEFTVLLKLMDTVERKVAAQHDAQHVEWMEQIKETARPKREELQAMAYRAHPVQVKIYDKMKDVERVGRGELIDLHMAVRKCVRHLWLVDEVWSDTVDEAFNIEAELDETNLTATDSVAVKSSEPASGFMARFEMSPERQLWWRRRARPRVLLGMSIVFGMFSILMLWSELTLLAPGKKLSPFAGIVQGLMDVPVLQQIICIILLLYLFCCVAYTVFKVRVSSLYYVGPHHTDTNSLIYNGTVLLRVSIALAYNFGVLLDVQDGGLQQLIKVDDIAFLGQKFNQIFPIFMAVWALLIAVHAISKLMSLLDIQRFQFIANAANNAGELSDSAQEVKSQILEGKGLIKQEKRRRERARETGETYTPHMSGPQSPTGAGGGTPPEAYVSPSERPGGASGYRGKVLSKGEIRGSVQKPTRTMDGGDSRDDRNGGGLLSDGDSSGRGYLGRVADKASKYKNFGRKNGGEERKSFLDEV